MTPPVPRARPNDAESGEAPDDDWGHCFEDPRFQPWPAGKYAESGDRDYRLPGEPGYSECGGGPYTCGGCDWCLRQQAEYYANPDTFDLEAKP